MSEAEIRQHLGVIAQLAIEVGREEIHLAWNAHDGDLPADISRHMAAHCADLRRSLNVEMEDFALALIAMLHGR